MKYLLIFSKTVVKHKPLLFVNSEFHIITDAKVISF